MADRSAIQTHGIDGATDGAVTCTDSEDEPSAFIRRIECFIPLTSSERAIIAELESRRRIFPPRSDIIGQGDRCDRVLIIRRGWAMRHRFLPDGRRQVIHIALPGDLLCFNAHVFGLCDGGVSAITQVVAAGLDRQSILDLSRRFPRIAEVFAWCNAREQAAIEDRLVSLGRRSARSRVAHLLCELARRLKMLRLAENDHFHLPLNQTMIGDCVGLSQVHVNRMLQQLREMGVIETEGHSKITILNMKALEAIAELEDSRPHSPNGSAKAGSAV